MTEIILWGIALVHIGLTYLFVVTILRDASECYPYDWPRPWDTFLKYAILFWPVGLVAFAAARIWVDHLKPFLAKLVVR